MTPDQKQILKAWVAAGLWMVLIAIESTALLSSSNTRFILYPILHFLLGLDLARAEVWHHYLRKAGHFVGYFVLSVLLFRAWRTTLRAPSLWTLRWATIAFFMSALVASLDEWHQSYLPSRTGRVADVVLDSSAALSAQILIFLFLCLWRSARREEAGVAVHEHR